VLLPGTHFLGARCCGSGIIRWCWLREQGQQCLFVLADGPADVVGEHPFGRVDGEALALKGEVHAPGAEFIQESRGSHQKNSPS